MWWSWVKKLNDPTDDRLIWKLLSAQDCWLFLVAGHDTWNTTTGNGISSTRIRFISFGFLHQTYDYCWIQFRTATPKLVAWILPCSTTKIKVSPAGHGSADTFGPKQPGAMRCNGRCQVWPTEGLKGTIDASCLLQFFVKSDGIYIYIYMYTLSTEKVLPCVHFLVG